MPLEIVWLKEVTTRSQTNKRTHSDTNLPNELEFVLRRSSETLSLKLRRNHDINPKADFYFAQTLNDGKSALVKSPHWEREDVGYYQDMENAAFYTVKCIQQANAKCESVINGHIRIKDNAYELIPAANYAKSRNFLDFIGSLGTKYVLKKQLFTERDDSSECKDAGPFNEEDIKQELQACLRHLKRQDKEHDMPSKVYKLSTQNISAFNDRKATDVIRQQKKEYSVKVAVLIDYGLWEFYSLLVPEVNELVKRRKVMAKIRQTFSYIMNGVNMFYRGIERKDASISVRIFLADFVVFRTVLAFPHKKSQTLLINGTKYIMADRYLKDLEKWDKTEGVKMSSVFDNAMLFTRYKMYYCVVANYKHGITSTAGVCKPGLRTSIVEARGLFWTVFTAAHELGHNLGADHDGEGNAVDCNSEDNFIMSSICARPSTIISSKNPWIFSDCSVESIKKSLKKKKCMLVPGSYYDTNEYHQHLEIEAGVAYNASEQCRLLIGRYSEMCETVPADVCHAMRCTIPATGECDTAHNGAADGTVCGDRRKCVQARCVLNF
ncbi:hypothetical protein CHS0354_016513 [Potamilus streckersoni]|uniref:Peptidase M12B domain-containing protein n=1 Tax=Potamilus streckersoni TaxID=2493646 RepID=A0AAE0VXF1_9BIVA|nr:hypothetical protein CHS0354_016513 [Potamilus streckersoni]